MLKLVSSALFLFFVAGAFAAPQSTDPPSFGQQCGTIMGTVECAPGLKCCWVHPDDG
ncbi:hypothetical protein V5O48_003757, partial [Marasmius crinis-equi]